jgi:hypothetical protein
MLQHESLKGLPIALTSHRVVYQIYLTKFVFVCGIPLMQQVRLFDVV